MKIVVTADTHLKESGKLPARLTSEFQTADLIIHAGDWKTADVYTEIASYCDVKGVYGNIDGDDLRERLPAKQMLTIAGFRGGLVHGQDDKQTTARRASE